MSVRTSNIRKDPVRPVTLTVVAVGAVAFALACADASKSTSPQSTDEGGRQLAPSRLASALNADVVPGVVTLCKVGADGRFLVQVGTGTTPKTMTMGNNACQTIASVPPAQADDVIVTITEETGPTYALDHIELRHGANPARDIMNQRTVSFEAVHGAIVTYHNNAVVTVCKSGTAASLHYQIGLGQTTHQLALADGECRPIGTIPAAQQDDVIVTVGENASASYVLDHMMLTHGLNTAERISGRSAVSFEGAHGAMLTFHNNPVGSSGTGSNDHPQKKECTADKSLKDPKVHDENHDCRSPQGAASDPKSTTATTPGKSGKSK